MEEWELDFHWLKIRHYVANSLNKDNLPDLQAILFLIGIQEAGIWPGKDFTKEEKQDLMHVAVCTLLEQDGYYEFIGRDQDGWPHWKSIKKFDLKGLKHQEELLKEKVIQYFNLIETEN